MQVLGGSPVNRRLRFRHAPEYRRRTRLHPVRKSGSLHALDEVVETPRPLRFGVQRHLREHAAQTAPLRALILDRHAAHAHALKRVRDDVGRKPRVNERAQRHVSAGAAYTLEIRSFQFLRSSNIILSNPSVRAPPSAKPRAYRLPQRRNRYYIQVFPGRESATASVPHARNYAPVHAKPSDLVRPSFQLGDRPYLPAQSQFPHSRHPVGYRRVAHARNYGQGHRQVSRRFRHSHAARHVHYHVLRRQGYARPPGQHRAYQQHPVVVHARSDPFSEWEAARDW